MVRDGACRDADRCAITGPTGCGCDKAEAAKSHKCGKKNANATQVPHSFPTGAASVVLPPMSGQRPRRRRPATSHGSSGKRASGNEADGDGAALAGEDANAPLKVPSSQPAPAKPSPPPQANASGATRRSPRNASRSRGRAHGGTTGAAAAGENGPSPTAADAGNLQQAKIDVNNSGHIDPSRVVKSPSFGLASVRRDDSPSNNPLSSLAAVAASERRGRDLSAKAASARQTASSTAKVKPASPVTNADPFTSGAAQVPRVSRPTRNARGFGLASVVCLVVALRCPDLQR